MKYRGYIIRKWLKPIPSRKFDYDFWHQDYDGAVDSRDNRCGSASSVEAAKKEIDLIEDEANAI